MTDKTIIEAEANSLEEARNIAMAQIPEGLYLLSEKVISNGSSRSQAGMAETIEAAFAKARNEIPQNASVLKETVMFKPESRIIAIEAFDEPSARDQLKSQMKHIDIIRTVKTVMTGKKGFLGIGKQPNQYEAEVFRQAFVDITYKAPAKISITVGQKLWPSPGEKGYCQMCGKADTCFMMIGDRAIFLCSKQCEDTYGSLRVEALRHRNTNMIINDSGMDIGPLLAQRKIAYESKAFCWYCGQVTTMGAEQCQSCGREPDVKIPK